MNLPADLGQAQCRLNTAIAMCEIGDTLFDSDLPASSISEQFVGIKAVLQIVEDALQAVENELREAKAS